MKNPKHISHLKTIKPFFKYCANVRCGQRFNPKSRWTTLCDKCREKVKYGKKRQR